MRCGARGICKVPEKQTQENLKIFTVKKGCKNHFEQPCYKYFISTPSYRYACRSPISIKHHPDLN
jgi:hypothetical protein